MQGAGPALSHDISFHIFMERNDEMSCQTRTVPLLLVFSVWMCHLAFYWSPKLAEPFVIPNILLL